MRLRLRLLRVRLRDRFRFRVRLSFWIRFPVKFGARIRFRFTRLKIKL